MNIPDGYSGPFTTDEFADLIKRSPQTLRVWRMDESYPPGIRVVQFRRRSPLSWFINWEVAMNRKEPKNDLWPQK